MSATNGKKGITVTGVKAERFHRLRLAEVELVPETGLIRLTGKNGAGKTSFLRAIKAALGGAGEVLGEAVINDESEDGTGAVRLTLTNGFTVERRFTEATPKGYLTVTGPDGGRHNQGKLAEWLGPLSFDPSAFFSLSPQRQREILLALGGDPDLPRKLEELRSARAEKYGLRTPWISQQRRARQVEKPEGDRPEPVDVSAELTRMGQLQKQERERQDAFREAERLNEDGRAHQRHAAKVQEHIEDLERRLEEAREDHRRHLAAADDAIEFSEDAEAVARALPDVTADIEAVDARIREADRIQSALEPWKAYDRAREEVEESTQAIDALTAELDQFDAREAELIRSAGIPVTGLTFSEDGAPQLNGRPLSVASGAEKATLAVEVALANHPDLRICLLDEEANHLDLEGLQELDRLAREHGFQIWAARIGLEGAGEVVVEDGEAWARDAGRPEPAGVAP